jgi:hypothetical protein
VAAPRPSRVDADQTTCPRPAMTEARASVVPLSFRAKQLVLMPTVRKSDSSVPSPGLSAPGGGEGRYAAPPQISSPPLGAERPGEVGVSPGSMFRAPGIIPTALGYDSSRRPSSWPSLWPIHALRAPGETWMAGTNPLLSGSIVIGSARASVRPDF